MFRKKQQKRIVELSPAEVRLMLTALMNFRNKAMNAGKPTEDINDLIPLKVIPVTAVPRGITQLDTTRSWDMASLRIKTMLLYRAQKGFGTGAVLFS